MQQVDDVQSDEDINWMRNKFIIQWWRKMTGVSKTDGVKHEESPAAGDPVSSYKT